MHIPPEHCRRRLAIRFVATSLSDVAMSDAREAKRGAPSVTAPKIANLFAGEEGCQDIVEEGCGEMAAVVHLTGPLLSFCTPYAI